MKVTRMFESLLIKAQGYNMETQEAEEKLFTIINTGNLSEDLLRDKPDNFAIASYEIEQTEPIYLGMTGTEFVKYHSIEKKLKKGEY